MAFRRSEQSHARIRAVDCTAARAAPGVIAVFTAEDWRDAVKPLVATSRMANYLRHADFSAGARQGAPMSASRSPASSQQTAIRAENAAALIAIDYEPLPLVVDPEQAVRAGAPLLHEEAGTRNVIVSREFKRGDVEAASASAAVRVTGRFRMHRKSPVAIEPRLRYLAEYERDALTLHSATQIPGIIRDALSVRALDMPPDQVRVIAADVGGGFGGKGARSMRRKFSSARRRASCTVR